MAVCHWWSRLLSAHSGLWLVTSNYCWPLIGWCLVTTDHPRVTRPGWGSQCWPLCISGVTSGQWPSLYRGEHTDTCAQLRHVYTGSLLVTRETRDTWWEQTASYSQWLMTRAGEDACPGSARASWRDLGDREVSVWVSASLCRKLSVFGDEIWIFKRELKTGGIMSYWQWQHNLLTICLLLILFFYLYLWKWKLHVK